MATRCPVCHTPPRVVTHHTWVEKPSSTASARRSRHRVTPIRPGTHHARNTTNAARAALMPGSSWSAVTGPMIATRGMNRIAGNGANGTYAWPLKRMMSLGPRMTSIEVRPWRNASAR